MIPKELFRKIKQIEIRTKGLVHDVFGGEYQSAFKGRGIEFSEVRPYQFGDDIRSIDWNVSARSGDTFVKVFEEEREQTVMLLVDISASKDFGSRVQFKREMAAEICAVIAFSAIQNNDKVGLLMFSDQIELFVPPKKGKTHVLRLIRDLFAHEPTSAGTDIGQALEHVTRMLRRRSIVMIVSDFLDSGFDKRLRALANKHDTIAVHLHDPREEQLPSVGLLELTDAETGESILVDSRSSRVRNRYAENAAKRLQGLYAIFKRARVDTINIKTEEDIVEPLVRFFRTRNKSR